MIRQSSRQSQQGYLMLLAVIFIMVIGVMGTLMAYILAVRAPISAAQLGGFQALYMAESGLEIGARLLTVPIFSGTPSRLACSAITGNANITNASLFNGTFSLASLGSAPSFTYSSLSASINSSASSLAVANASGFASSGMAVIDGEVISYKSVSGNTLMNVRRGLGDLPASSHAGGATISQYQCGIQSQAGIPSIASPTFQRSVQWNVQLQDAWVASDKAGNTLRHYNWNRLSEIGWTADSISANKNTRANLYGISMLTSADGWSVGEEANNEFSITSWNGSAWSRNALAGACTAQHLYGVSMVSHTEGWAVGARYRPACAGTGNYRYTLLRWNGSAWGLLTPSTSPSIPADASTNQDLNAVHVTSVSGSGVGNLGFAVGNGGGILQFNGSAWTAATSPSTQNLKGVYIVSASEAWAVGASGTILKWNGSAWSAFGSPTSGNLNAITMYVGNGGSVATSGWAVGDSGLIITYNGSNWSIASSGTNKNLYGVGIYNAKDAWAVGDSGTMLHWQGGSWSSFNAPGVSTTLNAISVVQSAISPISDWKQNFR